MKKINLKKVKTFSFLISLLCLLGIMSYLSSCQQEELITIVPQEEQSILPKIIGQVDGFDVYESAEFLSLTDSPEDIQFPVLVETPESEYQLPLEDMQTGEVGLRGASHGIYINNPLLQLAATHKDSKWSAPSHHTPWNGTWATDLWKSGGYNADKPDYSGTCNRYVFLSLQIYNNGGHHYDAVKGKVVSTDFACASDNVDHGGHMQQIELYGKKNGTWHYLGWLVFAHLDKTSLVYSTGDEFSITTYPNKGYVYLGKISSKRKLPCSGSCHLHFEMKSSGWGNYHVGSGESDIGWSNKIWSFWKWFN